MALRTTSATLTRNSECKKPWVVAKLPMPDSLNGVNEVMNG